MSAKELRQKTTADLQKELLDLRREQFNLRMARASGNSSGGYGVLPSGMKIP